jgi:hypothetical protein
MGTMIGAGMVLASATAQQAETTVMASNKEDWRNVDVAAELSPVNQAAYAEMKEAYRVYAERKRAFENGMQASVELPETMELKFGYMFGKLSVAIGPKREAKAKATGDSGKSLSDWLRDKAASGHNS